MFPSETLERMEAVVTALARIERDQLEAGLSASAAETGHALKDAHEVLRQLNAARSGLTLPVYRSIRGEDELTHEERVAFRDNDPVAGTEYREMATLFVQMKDFLSDVSGALAHRAGRLTALPHDPDSDGPIHPPEWWPKDWTEEAVRLMESRAQSLHDNTRGFTRPLRC